jgi:hypothetical protein
MATNANARMIYAGYMETPRRQPVIPRGYQRREERPALRTAGSLILTPGLAPGRVNIDVESEMDIFFDKALSMSRPSGVKIEPQAGMRNAAIDSDGVADDIIAGAAGKVDGCASHVLIDADPP